MKASLVKMECRNIACISFAECKFDESGGLVVVGGQNGSGKSSLLESILFALGGKRAIGKDPLKYLEDRGYVTIHLSGVDYQIRRAINKSGHETLTVRDSDGNKLSQPQAVLKELIGAIGVDPSAIMQMNGKQVADKLRDVLGINLDDLDKKEKTHVDARAEAKRELNHAKSISDDAEFFDDCPSEPLSISDLISEVNRATEHNNKTAEIKADLNRKTDALKQARSRAQELRAELEKLERLIIDLTSERDSLVDTVNGINMIDTGPLCDKINSAEEINKRVAANKRHAELKEAVGKKETALAVAEANVNDVRRERQERISSAKLPLDGAGFNADGEFTLDDKPWHAWSSGERLFAAFELALAMNPEFKLLILRHGAWIDDVGRQDIAELAMERGYLVLMEVVGENDAQIVMYDGVMKDMR